MLMSKSRLEKFLYALYSLDSSDLPNPLSRIEELYKCLVTGEEPPTFEPLSRVEKYLMAILGVYDVDSLPNPLSRVEVLLYKLAIGDDNLDDVKSFISEHEELLAEIIRNGGVGGNINIEYVLYTLSTEFSTLYNTAEKPIKSAILKGSTKYRDIDTGDILDTFDETKNLELVSVQMPVLTTSNEDGTKTNILTTNEEVELRKVGDVQDKLNLLTGELTQRIGEVIIDGSGADGIFVVKGGWDNDTHMSFDFYHVPSVAKNKTNVIAVVSDKFKSVIRNYQNNSVTDEFITNTGGGSLFVMVRKDGLSSPDVDGFNLWLKSNPLVIQYILETESVKTVDLSVVDQDGNDTELSTFDDITYVTLSSEGLIPEAELEVATKNKVKNKFQMYQT